MKIETVIAALEHWLSCRMGGNALEIKEAKRMFGDVLEDLIDERIQDAFDEREG